MLQALLDSRATAPATAPPLLHRATAPPLLHRATAPPLSSSVVRLFQLCDIKFHHLHHRLHNSTCSLWIVASEEF